MRRRDVKRIAKHRLLFIFSSIISKLHERFVEDRLQIIRSLSLFCTGWRTQHHIEGARGGPDIESRADIQRLVIENRLLVNVRHESFGRFRFLRLHPQLVVQLGKALLLSDFGQDFV